MHEFSQEIWETTYKYKDEKNISETFSRVAKAIASVEKSEDQEEWQNKFYDILNSKLACPGGRILANAGTDYNTTLFNCFTAPNHKYDPDSMEGILSNLLIQSLTLKSEGGWGENFSYLRPRSAFINGIGVETPGSTKFMELFNKSSEIITSGSGHEREDNHKDKRKKGRIRKGAQMGLLFNYHPDIEEFITAKRTANKLDKFNVSVASYNSFMDKVVRVEETGVDEQIDLYFPDTTYEKYKQEWDGDLEQWLNKEYPIKIYKKISVKYLWNLIMKSTYDFNDPGVIFIDRANETYLANYLQRITKCNPCGEQTMPHASVCDLGSIVLPHHFKNGHINLTSISQAVKIMVRFLDNVNDYSKTPHEAYSKSAKEMRRIGLGIMGWGSLLYLMKIRYGSAEAEYIKDKIMESITHTAIQTSAELAEEKGCFKGCDPEKILANPYIQRLNLSKHTIEQIAKHGLRNSALFSIQPNGNTSVVNDIMSGGCEPVPWHEFIRTFIVQTPPQHFRDLCPKYWEGEFCETDMFKFAKEGEETILKGVDIKTGITYKVDKNRGLTKEVLCEDYAVSILKKKGEWNSKADWAATIDNLTVENHITDLKGWAKWIDASISKTVNLPNDYPFEDFKKLYLDAYKSGVIKGITTYRANTMTNVLASIEKKDNKRPRKLPCHVYHPVVKGEKYYVCIGLNEGKCYEIFAGNNGIDNNITEGFIQRIKGGRYTLVSDNEVIIESLSDHCSNEQEAIARLASINLRSGIDIKLTVNQLEKVRGDLQNFSKVMCRILRKYLPVGTQSENDCPECGKKLVHSEGCLKCNCGFSRC